jgi:hypothetical protein
METKILKKRGPKPGVPRQFRNFNYEVIFINHEGQLLHKKFSTSTQILKDPDLSVFIKNKVMVNYYCHQKPDIKGDCKRRAGYLKITKIREAILVPVQKTKKKIKNDLTLKKVT